MGELVGKEVTAAHPIVDAALPDGSRLNIIYSEDVSIKGSSFTIRKFSAEPFSFTRLVSFNTISAQLAAYIWLCCENRMNIFICGETASGKTTTLNAIIPLIHLDSKMYTVEDTPEVLPPHRIWQQVITRPAGVGGSSVEMFDLIRAGMRSRSDYIIVGETRGREALAAFQAMQAGRAVMSTFHAGSIRSMIQRFTGDPINVPIRFMDNLHVVLIQRAVYHAGRMVRRVLTVGEILGYSRELGGIMSREVFVWDPATDLHRFRGMYNSYILENLIAESKGYVDKRKIYGDLARRTKIVEMMVEHGIVGYHETNAVIHAFQQYGEAGLPFKI
jgi:flagellar protein FlaI